MGSSKVRTILASIFVISLVAGCVGPPALKASRIRYNQAIQQTQKELLLLNLVRLQYREEPLFLDVNNVATQFSFRQSADISGTINEGPSELNPDALDLGAGLAFEERPTVTLTPLQGEDYAIRMLKPVDLRLVLGMERSGWSIDRVMRVMIQKINRIDNASGASGPTPADAPVFEEFEEVCRQFRSLQKRGMLRLRQDTLEEDEKEVLAFPLKQATLEEILLAKQQGYDVSIEGSGDDGRVLIEIEKQGLLWTIPPEAQDSTEVARIRELLELDPALNEYEIEAGLTEKADRSQMLRAGDKILILTRSLMGTMFYLSHAIDVPERHREKGYVTTTLNPDGTVFNWSRVTQGLLTIHSSRLRPSDAAVSVQYMGYWYYLDQADLTSKSTFGLLGQVFALQAGSAEGDGPVLTLPVGG